MKTKQLLAAALTAALVATGVSATTGFADRDDRGDRGDNRGTRTGSVGC